MPVQRNLFEDPNSRIDERFKLVANLKLLEVLKRIQSGNALQCTLLVQLRNNFKMEPKRIISKGVSPYYMKVYLEFDEGDPPDMTVAQFKALILHAINVLFGEVGQASIQVDILKYKEEKRSALLRVNGSGFVQLWSALTLCGVYSNRSCAFRITQVSSSLMALAVNSRTFHHRPVQQEADR